METSIDGTENDAFDVELDPSEDYVAAKGMAFENEDGTRIYKDGDDMEFLDNNNTTPVTLTELKEGADLAQVGRYAIVLQHNGSVSDGTFIGYDSLIPGDASPIIFPEPCSIFEFTFTNSRTSADYTLEFRKNSTVATPFYTVSKTNTQFFADTAISEDFAAGDQIYIKYVDDGTNAQDLVMCLYMQNEG